MRRNFPACLGAAVWTNGRLAPDRPFASSRPLHMKWVALAPSMWVPKCGGIQSNSAQGIFHLSCNHLLHRVARVEVCQFHPLMKARTYCISTFSTRESYALRTTIHESIGRKGSGEVKIADQASNPGS